MENSKRVEYGSAPTKHAAYLRARSVLEAYLECEAERLARGGYGITRILLGHSQLRDLCVSPEYTPYLDRRLMIWDDAEENTATVGLWYSIEICLVDLVSLVQFETSQAASTGKTARL